jgi:hypothetical protein
MAGQLPANLAAALNRWHLPDDAARLVAQLELCDQPVEVRRLTLGDPHRPEFGTIRTIYRTKDQPYA